MRSDRPGGDRARRTRALHRRSQQHDASRRQFTFRIRTPRGSRGPPRLCPTRCTGRAPNSRRAAGECRSGLADGRLRGRVSEHRWREPGLRQAIAQQKGLQPVHPQAVDDDDRDGARGQRSAGRLHRQLDADVQLGELRVVDLGGRVGQRITRPTASSGRRSRRECCRRPTSASRAGRARRRCRRAAARRSCSASSRKPNFCCACSREMPSRSNTALCRSSRWMRIEPPPISEPFSTMS